MIRKYKFIKGYAIIVFLCLLCLGSTAFGQKGDDLQKYLTGREKAQAAEEMEEQFPVASAVKPLADDPEYQTYFRLSVAGKHMQLWERVLVMSFLAIVCLVIRSRRLFPKK